MASHESMSVEEPTSMVSMLISGNAFDHSRKQIRQFVEISTWWSANVSNGPFVNGDNWGVAISIFVTLPVRRPFVIVLNLYA